MEGKDKKLLLIDICGRLLYGVKVQKLNEAESAFEVYAINAESTQISFFKYKGKSLEICDGGFLISPNNFLRFKPYLRSMDSMTEEECDEWAQLESDEWGANSIDWLNRKMFDYRGLIPMGLALEAPEGMYN